MRKMSMLELTEPRKIWVPWTMSAKAAHALSLDGKTPLGPGSHSRRLRRSSVLYVMWV
jgi:hypothetical protein